MSGLFVDPFEHSATISGEQTPATPEQTPRGEVVEARWRARFNVADELSQQRIAPNCRGDTQGQTLFWIAARPQHGHLRFGQGKKLEDRVGLGASLFTTQAKQCTPGTREFQELRLQLV